jgi:segregation and condensation protein A
MDLLLYLVRKDEVDLYDIPIAQVTDQYIRYTEVLKRLDVNLASDFLVMAATLMEIKSVMLLPRVESDETAGEEGADPRAELVRQLLEYKKFKDAANLLNAVADQRGERFNRPDTIMAGLNADQTEHHVDLEQVSVWDLLDAFDAICRATGQLENIQYIKDDTPIDLYQIEILDRLQSAGGMTFRRLLEHRPHRLALVGQFLALLELVRWKLVGVEQVDDSADLFLSALTEEPAAQVVSRVIHAVEDESSEARQDVAPDDPYRQQLPPIPIVELPAKKAKTGDLAELGQTESASDASQSKIDD